MWYCWKLLYQHYEPSQSISSALFSLTLCVCVLGYEFLLFIVAHVFGISLWCMRNDWWIRIGSSWLTVSSWYHCSIFLCCWCDYGAMYLEVALTIILFLCLSLSLSLFMSFYICMCVSYRCVRFSSHFSSSFENRPLQNQISILALTLFHPKNSLFFSVLRWELIYIILCAK